MSPSIGHGEFESIIALQIISSLQRTERAATRIFILYKVVALVSKAHSGSLTVPPRLIPSICVWIAPAAETVHKKSELPLCICGAMAEGGGDSTFVSFLELEVIVWVDSETIGSAAIAENDIHQKVKTTKKAIQLFLRRSDINLLLNSQMLDLLRP